jgi:hypothetical protein
LELISFDKSEFLPFLHPKKKPQPEILFSDSGPTIQFNLQKYLAISGPSKRAKNNKLFFKCQGFSQSFFSPVW